MFNFGPVLVLFVLFSIILLIVNNIIRKIEEQLNRKITKVVLRRFLFLIRV